MQVITHVRKHSRSILHTTREFNFIIPGLPGTYRAPKLFIKQHASFPRTTVTNCGNTISTASSPLFRVSDGCLPQPVPTVSAGFCVVVLGHVHGAPADKLFHQSLGYLSAVALALRLHLALYSHAIISMPRASRPTQRKRATRWTRIPMSMDAAGREGCGGVGGGGPC